MCVRGDARSGVARPWCLHLRRVGIRVGTHVKVLWAYDFKRRLLVLASYARMCLPWYGLALVLWAEDLKRRPVIFFLVC